MNIYFSTAKIPLFILAEAGKISFFPGRSYLFWLLVAMAFYLGYLYSTSKNKKAFFKSPFNQIIAIAIAAFLLSYICTNIFVKNPSPKEEVAEIVVDINKLLLQDQKYSETLPENFINPNFHYKYINNHFSIPANFTNSKNEQESRDDFSIFNAYYDKLWCSDTLYINNARLALGFILLKEDSLESSLNYFNAISTEKFPMANAFIADIYLRKNDTTNSLKHYTIAAESGDYLKEHSREMLIQLLKTQQNDAVLYQYLLKDDYKKYFPSALASKLYLLNNNFLDYYTVTLKHTFRDFKFTGLLAAFIILLVWTYYIVGMDFFEKEKNKNLFLTFFCGAAFCLLAFYFYDFLEYRFHFYQQSSNEFIYCVFGIGFIEEFVKILPLLILVIFTKNIINEPYDYILYAAISALGFAFIENLIYFNGDLDGIIHGRGLTSVPGHVIDSSIIAYGLVLARYRYPKLPSIVGFLIFFFLGALNHGLYDYWLIQKNQIFFTTNFLISVSIWLIIINNCLNNSPSFSQIIESRTKNIQLILCISLIGILVMEYLLVSWENGPLYANQAFNSNLIWSGFFIIYYSHRLTNIDLVQGYWHTITLKSIEDKRTGKMFSFRSFFMRLITGDLFPMSFVSKQIILQADPSNTELLAHFYHQENGSITERKVVTCHSNSDGEYEDPNWFKIKLKNPIYVGGRSEDSFIFRFEDESPSFENEDILSIFLYVEVQKGVDKISKRNLRALGKAMIKNTEA